MLNVQFHKDGKNKLKQFDNTFFDIHCHALNLSHPNMTIFLNTLMNSKKIIIEALLSYLKKETSNFPDFLKEQLKYVVAQIESNIKSLFNPLTYLKILSKGRSFNLFDLFDGKITIPEELKNTFIELFSLSNIAKIPVIGRFLNALSVMENDPGEIFLLMEDCLSGKYDKNIKLLENNNFKIDNNIYSKIILTPLLIDFYVSSDNFYQKIHYSSPPKKYIENQIYDIFHGIKKYKEKSKLKLLEIYPFLGLNTKNYSLFELKNILNGYFSEYTGKYKDFKSNFDNFYKNFNGDISTIKSNFFAGIKFYPPLGFNPFPERGDDNWIEEREKVFYIYNFCISKNIPITTHCADEGFTGSKNYKEYSSPLKWKKVLDYVEGDTKIFKNLKLNLAHFGFQGNIISLNEKWDKIILDMIVSYKNVYSDFSFYADYKDYYKYLVDLIDDYVNKYKLQKEESLQKIKKRLMFGSDFSVNLINIDSYSDFIDIFSKTDKLHSEEKHKFCSTNPATFLFEPIS